MLWKRRRDEDEMDRVNRLWTVLIFGIAGGLLLLYVAVFPDDAISCTPADGGNMSVHHANRYCINRDLLSHSPDYYSYGDMVSFHTLVSIYCFLQILAFLTPHAIFHFLRGMFGDETEFLFQCAEDNVMNTKRGSSYVTNRIKSPSKPCKALTVLYLLKKTLAFINSLIQMVVIIILSPPAGQLSSDRRFPNSAYCTVNSKAYFCSLHINKICERLYFCMFLWLLAVTVANVASLVGWVLKLFVPRLTSRKINKYTLTDDHDRTQKFLKDIVGRDFLLILLLSESTEREITAADLTFQLWQSHEADTGTDTNGGKRNSGLDQEMNQM